MKEIRLLRKEEIECRIGTINEKGLTLLLYKDARVDMRILDETYSPMGWQRSHTLIGDNLYCTISVYDEDKKCWISKSDVGVESFSEKEKSEASDSFKRASTVWGIGRELYSKIQIWIPATKAHIQRKADKFVSYDKFKVKEIGYNENREIVKLIISNQDNKEVFVYGKEINNIQEEKIILLNKELARTGVALDAVLNRYRVSCVEEMTDDTYKKAMSGLKKTKDRTKVA